jgi:hypothetical protein
MPSSCARNAPLGVRVGHVDEVIDVTRVEGFERPPHELHVLLRHPLLPPPHGLEGLGLRVEQADELAVLDREHVRDVGLHGRAARSAVPW